MGAKGKRRREKNYRAAHGGYTALPPPPDPSQLDALPSKLRQIISFTQSQHQRPSLSPSHSLLLLQSSLSHLSPSMLSGTADSSSDMQNSKKNDHGHPQNHIHLKNKGEVETANVKRGDTSEQLKAPQYADSGDEQIMQSSANDKKKKKGRRKEVKDLRFAMEVDKTSSQIKRRERKKKYLEAKKKHKKTSAEEKLDFPGREKIKFGDIVLAPPKLAVTPKAFKNVQDASQERLRLRAIEAYRSRKGWTSRPGSHLPPPVATSTP